MEDANQYEGRSHSTRRPDQKVRDSSINPSTSLNSKRHSDQILDAMILHSKPTTRKQLTKITDFESNQVTAHVNTLIKEGKILESKQKAPCPITGNKVYWLKVAPKKGIQTELSL